MLSIMVYFEDTDGERIAATIPVANGFVQRCVSAIAEYNLPDAERCAAILNAAAAASASERQKK